jgi:hypothetical protein
MWALVHQIGLWINQSSLAASARSLANIYFWLIPFVQITHLLGMSVLMGSAGLYGLRLLRAGDDPERLRQAGTRLVPFVIGGLSVQSATGLFMVVHRPTRAFDSLMFLPKMALIVVAIGLFFGVLHVLKRLSAPDLSLRLRIMGAGLLSCMMAITLAGRLISFLRAS